MAQIEMNAEPRTVVGKQVRSLRKDGLLPVVLYGPGVESRALQVGMVEAETIVRDAGTSHLIALKIAGDEQSVPVLVRGLQRNALRRELTHIDLYQVQMTKVIHVEVPIVLIGESPVIARGDGVLLQGMQTVEIECLPGDLIDAIEINLGQLTQIDQQVTIANLQVPETVRILSDADSMVLRVSAVEEGKVEEEMGAAVAEPELIRRRREEEGGE